MHAACLNQSYLEILLNLAHFAFDSPVYRSIIIDEISSTFKVLNIVREKRILFIFINLVVDMTNKREKTCFRVPFYTFKTLYVERSYI